jgi:hypothetical protein
MSFLWSPYKPHLKHDANAQAGRNPTEDMIFESEEKTVMRLKIIRQIAFIFPFATGLSLSPVP